ATRLGVVRRVLVPRALPGLLTAGLLVLADTVANFELTFLLSGAGWQALVVALYFAVFAAGMRPIYSVDAMAVIYMAVVLAVLVLALRLVRPTQMVFRLERRDCRGRMVATAPIASMVGCISPAHSTGV